MKRSSVLTSTEQEQGKEGSRVSMYGWRNLLTRVGQFAQQLTKRPMRQAEEDESGGVLQRGDIMLVTKHLPNLTMNSSSEVVG